MLSCLIFTLLFFFTMSNRYFYRFEQVKYFYLIFKNLLKVYVYI